MPLYVYVSAEQGGILSRVGVNTHGTFLSAQRNTLRTNAVANSMLSSAPASRGSHRDHWESAAHLLQM